MTVPKKVVTNYLTQLEKIDGMDAERVTAKCTGHFKRYHELGTEIHHELKLLKILRIELTNAAQ